MMPRITQITVEWHEMDGWKKMRVPYWETPKGNMCFRLCCATYIFSRLEESKAVMVQREQGYFKEGVITHDGHAFLFRKPEVRKIPEVGSSDAEISRLRKDLECLTQDYR